MTHPELLARVAWNYLVEPGDRIAGLLVQELGAEQAMAKFLQNSLEPLLELGSGELASAFERWRPRLVTGRASELLRQASVRGIHPILPSDPQWPSGFADLGQHQPIMLWSIGSRTALSSLQNAISVVGSRTVTNYGNWATTEIVSELCALGVATISGGALGVDSVVHRSTLRFDGTTIAVMAGGLFNLYPSGNQELFEKIARTGLLISEMAPDARPTRWRFLQRNRLIAALGQAVLVTEAGYRSGSINTANHALDLARPVFALPGQVNSPNSAGCNRLILEGKAEIIADIADLPYQLGLREPTLNPQSSLGSLELRLFDVLTDRYQEESAIAALAGLNSSELRIAIGGLELLGLVKRAGTLLAKDRKIPQG